MQDDERSPYISRGNMIGAAVWRALSKGTCTYTPLVPWLRRVQTTYAGGPSRAGQSFWCVEGWGVEGNEG